MGDSRQLHTDLFPRASVSNLKKKIELEKNSFHNSVKI